MTPNSNSRITLGILSQQIADLREEIRALRVEIRETMGEMDNRIRCVEREQARITERTGILSVIITAAATAVATLVSYFSRR